MDATVSSANLRYPTMIRLETSIHEHDHTGMVHSQRVLSLFSYVVENHTENMFDYIFYLGVGK